MIVRIKKNKDPYLLWCLGIVAWICVAQVLGNQLLLLSGLGGFVLLSIVATYKSKASLLLLFFLPWSPLLKLAPGTITVYTIVLVAVCMVTFLLSHFTLNRMCVAFAFALSILTLFSKLMEEYTFGADYLVFLFMLFLFPGIMRELRGKVDFRTLTLYFAVGIISAALSAKYLVRYPQIARYIDVFNWHVVTRLSGYYGDANFYAAHITAALSGVLLLFMYDKSRDRILWGILAILLLYCGFLSASKSFIVTIAVLLVVWFVRFLFSKRPLKQKIAGLIVVLILVTVVLASGAFREQWEVVVFRFNESTTLSGLTTGRTAHWMNYLKTLTSEVKVLLVGKGFTNIHIDGKSPHNTIIQLVYQFGLVGCVFLVLWMIYFSRGTLKYFKARRWKADIAILLIGIFMPWLGIDLVFFDELFLMPMYMMAGIIYVWTPDINRKDGAIKATKNIEK